jgi:hypothetical protein
MSLAVQVTCCYMQGLHPWKSLRVSKMWNIKTPSTEEDYKVTWLSQRSPPPHSSLGMCDSFYCVCR